MSRHKTPNEMLADAWTVRVEPQHFALEWDIIGNPFDSVSTHQRREFYDEVEFNSYHANIVAAAREHMCENVRVFTRKVEVSPWMEKL